MERRRLRSINTELNYWDIGFGIDMAQNRPGAMVETPTVVSAHRHRQKQSLDLCRKVGIARRRILYLVQLARKSAEIVDRSWRRAHGHGCIFDVPVRRDRKYRLGPREGSADNRPLLRIWVYQQCIHRIPMPHEQGRHSFSHSWTPSLISWLTATADSTPVVS